MKKIFTFILSAISVVSLTGFVACSSDKKQESGSSSFNLSQSVFAPSLSQNESSSYSSSSNDVSVISPSINDDSQFSSEESESASQDTQSTTSVEDVSITNSEDVSQESSNENTSDTHTSVSEASSVSAETSSETSSITEPIDYGTLTIANVSTFAGFTTEINPIFSKDAEEITYTYDTSKIYVNGLMVTGKIANTTCEVTATTDHLTTKFTVTVNSNDFLDRGGYQNSSSGFLTTLNQWQNNYKNYQCDKDDMTIFIGDSFFDSRNFFSDFYSRFASVNAFTMGISSSRADQWVWYSQYLFEKNPKNIVIHVGTNDIFDGGKNATQVTNSLKELFTVLKTNLPTTHVYWYSIEPRIGSSDASGNAIAEQVNENVKTYIETQTNLTYLDSYTSFKNDLTLYKGGDTVHPACPTGYNKMMSILAEAGHTFSTNSHFSGAVADWETSSSETFANSKAMPVFGTQFAFESIVNVNSYTTNAHVTFNFNGQANNRFLIWDNNSDGIFNFGGALNGNYDSNSKNTISSNVNFKVVVLLSEKNAYLIINDSLQRVFAGITSLQFNSITVGSEGCAVSFSNNVVSSPSVNAEKYAECFNTEGITNYESVTYNTVSIDYPASLSVLDDWTTTTSTNFFDAKTVQEADGTFAFSCNITILSTVSNGHITLNFNGSGDTRFLIWNSANNNVFYFGGINGTVMNSSKNYLTLNKTVLLTVLKFNNHAYMFIEDSLVTVYVKAPQVSSFTFSSESCSVKFENIQLSKATTNSAIYNKMIANPDVISYESWGNQQASSYFIDNNVTENYTTTNSDNCGNAIRITNANGKFLYETTFRLTTTLNNGHITINVNDNTGANRFLIWNKDSDNKFYLAMAKNGVISVTENYLNLNQDYNLKVLVSNKNAYLFINDDLKIIFESVGEIKDFFVGTENCICDFSSINVFKAGYDFEQYNTVLENVEAYE